MKILLITDIHYGEDTNYPKHPRDLGENYVNSFGSRFESYVSNLRSVMQQHDLVVNLGDLIHETQVDDDIIRYKKTLELLDSGRPVKNVIGNHDLNNMSRVQVAAIIGEEKVYYSFDLGGYHHIVLDGYRETKADPHQITPEQIEWLKNDLEKTGFPVLVYCHYPLDEQDMSSNYYFGERPERGRITNRVEVRTILEDSKKVIAVFSGHLHFYHQETINGIEYFTVPSFTENNGSHIPQAKCLSVSLEGSVLSSELSSINPTSE